MNKIKKAETRELVRKNNKPIPRTKSHKYIGGFPCPKVEQTTLIKTFEDRWVCRLCFIETRIPKIETMDKKPVCGLCGIDMVRVVK